MSAIHDPNTGICTPPPKEYISALLDDGGVKLPFDSISDVTSCPTVGVDPSNSVPLEYVKTAVGDRCATPRPPSAYGMKPCTSGSSYRSPPSANVAGTRPVPIVFRPVVE